MQWAIILALAIHMLAAVFWAGSTFTLARTGGDAAAQLFRPQMGAATLAVLSGAYLWFGLHHEGSSGPAELVLRIAAMSALVAATLQGAVGGQSLAALRRRQIDEGVARSRLALAHRLAAALLAVAAVGMVIARFA